MNKDRVYYQRNPVEWTNRYLGANLYGKQIEIINSLVDKNKLAISSGHGLGNTFILSCISLWFLFNFYPSRVFLFAPTMRQMRNILFPEISKLRTFIDSDEFNTGELFLNKLVVDENNYIIGSSNEIPKELNEPFNGHQLFLFDEGGEIHQPIIDKLELVFNSPNTKTVFTGKPLRSDTYFYRIQSGNGSGYCKINLSCFDSPNIKWNNEIKEYEDIVPSLYPGLVNLACINRTIERYGKDSGFVQSRVYGEFPH